MKCIASLVLLLLSVGAVLAQEKLSIALPAPTKRPIIILPPPPPPPPPVCYADEKLQAATAADPEEEEGSADGQDGPESLVWVPPRRRCEDGPVRKLVGGPNVFYWPPIYRGSCDNLFCKDPPCIARWKVRRYRCVLVYRFIRGCWRKIGFRTISFEDHLSCSCKTCRDIRDREWCVKTEPCPNSNNNETFCYWRQIFPIGKRQVAADAAATSLAYPIPFFPRCDCCKPFKCPAPKIFSRQKCACVCPAIRCPPGRIFNPATCKCDCPKGSRLIGNKCIGDCEDINTNQCRFVFCKDNKHFNCQLNPHNKCECSSCERANDEPWCRMTNCLEQSTKPMCKWDRYTRRCRCPRCDDQKDQKWCVMTKCGPNNHLTCKWESYWKKCFCPH